MPTDYTRNTINGALIFSRMVNGYLITHTYFGYTVREARAEFSQLCHELSGQIVTEKARYCVRNGNAYYKRSYDCFGGNWTNDADKATTWATWDGANRKADDMRYFRPSVTVETLNKE